MGTFYVNHTVRAPQDRVSAFLKKEGRTAFVSPTFNGYTVACDRQCDEQDPIVIARLGQKMSAYLECPVLAVLNHDDAILCYWLFEHGHLVEEYDSFPDCFEDEEEEEDEDFGGFRLYKQEEDWRTEDRSDDVHGRADDGEELCRVLGNPALREQVRWILAGRDTLFAEQIHQELVRVLSLPPCTLGAGYKCVAQRCTELDRDDCIHIGQDTPSPELSS